MAEHNTQHAPFEEDVLLNHNYDGIQEYDNPMPTWWSLIFWVTVIWAVLYVIGISTGIIPDYEADLATSQQELASIRDKHRQLVPPKVVDEATLAAAVSDDKALAQGKTAFIDKCSPCHGQEGQGSIGPNLTDDNWLYGGTLADIHKSIEKGFPDKGMPPWGPLLKDEEVISLVAFVRSIRGTTPPNPKAAEGEVYVPDEG